MKVGIAATVLGPSGKRALLSIRTGTTAPQDAERPLFEAYFAHQRDDDVCAEMARKSAQVLGKQ
ncbi:hypothetical protein ACGFMK_17510 [Amycolatopsis sp. NPDC049252]|uniref:hypothetical protein n=1 Tax=Amycolatopsis sp. NPDC049252 TaxID=3363933 RepID=UPI0037103688